MSCQCGCGGGCGQPPTSYPITNLSGQSRLGYRVGTFATFRRSLLSSLPGETELAGFAPTAADDLGLQVLDWWAYIADILTFYNERIVAEHYLATAVLDSSVAQLVGLLGYRPRPGIAATGALAVLASGPGPLVLPAGLAIASKASPGLESQTFETTAATSFARPTSVPGPVAEDLTGAAPDGGPPASAGPGAAVPPPHTQLLARGGVLVRGTPASVAVGDRLLLATKAWGSPNEPAAIVRVTGLSVEKDAHGRKNTRVRLTGTGALPAGAKAADYRLAYPTHTGHLSSLPAGASVVSGSTLVLDAPARYLKAGDPLLVELPGAGVGGSPGSGFDVVRLTEYAEQLWYANAAAGSPGAPPAGDTPGIPLVVGKLTVAAHSGANLPGGYGGQSSKVVVRSGWTDVAPLLDTPVATLTALPGKLTLAGPPAAPAGVAHPALLEDAAGTGAKVSATPVAGTAEVAIAGGEVTGLAAPLRLLWDLVTVSRGATVADEQLGTGDATRPGQDFALAKSPVTFLADFPGRSGDGYSSTVLLTVAGRYWTEVPTLYGHGPDEAIFCTYNDDEGRTHVRTGDGRTGRRLPSGAAVSAGYRVGSGAAVPPAGSLTQVLSAVPNLRSVRNPVPPGGGSDPEPADRLRALAPRSVLTFGRAVSGTDYAAVAAAAPGVARAASVWEWDPAEQRPVVRVYVGDDDGALASARAALRAQTDPNRPLTVLAAVPCRTALRMVLRLDPSYVAEPVYAAVRTAVLDSLFAPGVLALGEPLYRSRIEEVVTAVPGVLASHHLKLRWYRGGRHTSSGPRFSPGPGGFFALRPDHLYLSKEEAMADV
ncbi:MAG: baseplate J/gp47 family protein [Actinobacteria bacterium]|nr:baseplate J/gp47 family protein [Actinomycetota bacterium]